MVEPKPALVIFSRYPRLGKVKTRLQPFLGAEACLKLHTAFLLDTLGRTATLTNACHLYLSECSNQELGAFALRYRLHPSVRPHPQVGPDLGARLWNACREILQESNRVVFVGTDTPSLPLAYIREAWVKLLDFPVTVGPCDDGGYYLLGVSQPKPELFEGIQWGTSRVCEQTLAKLSEPEYFLLPRWYDVDTSNDLTRLERDLEGSFEGFPQFTELFFNQLTAETDRRRGR